MTEKNENLDDVTLELEVFGPAGEPYPGRVDVFLRHRVLHDRRDLRDQDASKTIRIAGLRRAPQGVYAVYVTPSDRWELQGQFVMIPASGHATLEYTFDAEPGKEPPRFFVQGHVWRRDGERVTPFAGVAVRALDRDPQQVQLLGESRSEEDGFYQIEYTSEKFRDRSEVGGPELVVEAVDADGATLAASPERPNAQALETVDLIVEVAPQQPWEEFVVSGTVRHADGVPEVDVLVRAVDVDLRSEEPLGETRTDSAGRYVIPYSADQFRRAEKKTADLRVRAFDAAGEELAVSEIVFQTGPSETVDLVVGARVFRGPSEYERLKAAIEPLLEGVEVADLQEDEERQDVTFLSGETGEPAIQIAFLVAAHRLAGTVEVAPEVFYGLFRQDLPTNLPALALQDAELLREALLASVAENLVPERFAADVDDAVARLRRFVVEDPGRDGAEKGPLVSLVGTVVGEPERQQAFLERFVDHEGPIEEFWADLENSDEFRDDAAALRFTVQVGAFSGNHLPLVSELQRLRGDGQIAVPRDLVRFDEGGWRQILERPHGDGVVGAPEATPGEGEGKLAFYSRTLTRLVERSFASPFVAARLEQEDREEDRNMRIFFAANQESFDLTGSRLETYLARNPGALDGIAEEERAALRQELRAFQRVYRVAPQYEATRALLAAGFDSAHAMARMAPTTFALKHGRPGSLGDLTTAYRIQARAEWMHGLAVALITDHGLTSGRTPIWVVPEEPAERAEGIPDWRSLFGSLDLCECRHCRSIFSPAAYLTDVLSFLSDRLVIDPDTIVRDAGGRITGVEFKTHPDDPTKDLTARDLLFLRRGDLGDIELTCENTNTPLPYVDLVNEALEGYVEPPPAFAPFDLAPARAADLDARTVTEALRTAFTPPLSEHASIEVEEAGERWRVHDEAFSYSIRLEGADPPRVVARSRQTRGSAEELLANPQYLHRGAYDKLAAAVFPMALPFDLEHAEARAYLGHLDVARGRLREAFLPGDRAARLADAAVARETLGLTGAQADLIRGAKVSDAEAAEPGMWNLWGFERANLDAASAIPDPADGALWITSGAWLDVLTGRIDVFLQQSDLTYKEMLALLGTYYVNPQDEDGDRPITVQARDGAPPATCETRDLRIVGMDEPAALRALRFVRLWRALGWTMRDLDRVLAALGATALDQGVLTELGHLVRLRDRLRLSVEALAPFRGPIDAAEYLDHEAGGQPPHESLYDKLFRNKRVVNPPDPAFAEDPAALAGLISEHTAAISAGLGASASDVEALRVDAGVIPHVGGPPAPDDSLTLENLSRLYRHAVLAKALKLAVPDYLIALGLAGDPFATTLATVLFVERVDAVRAAGLSFAELDYLSRHRIPSGAPVAPTEEETAQTLDEVRAELQRIAADNVFVEAADDPAAATVDAEGDLTAAKLALLGWTSDLVDEAVATLAGTREYRAPLAALPAGVSLPADLPQAVFAGGVLRFAGAMTIPERDTLLALSVDADYQAAVTALFAAPRTFVRRHMRRFTIERFSAPLAALPAVEFPAPTRERIYFDSGAGRLFFVGAMSDDERDALLALSADADYQAAVTALAAAPDAPPADEAFLTAAGADPDTARLFDAVTTAAERFALVLRKLLPHLRKVLSRNAVIQSLAEALGLEYETARDLLAARLERSGAPGQPLLDAFLDPAFAGSNPELALAASTFPGPFEAYSRIHKVALLVDRFAATPLQVDWLFTHQAGGGWPDVNLLPIAEQDAPAADLEQWVALTELFAVRDALPRGEEALDDLLRRAVAVAAADPGTEKDAAKASYLNALSAWTAWPLADLVTLLGQEDDFTQTGVLAAAFPDDYAGPSLLARLLEAFAMMRRLGLSAAQCGLLAAPDVTTPVAQMVKQAVRARYDDDQWLDVARPLRDPLREEQRAALVAYLLVHPDPQHRWRDTADIYAYFLLDVEMSPCQLTSRIKQAISSVQLFVQRCLMNLEPEILASAETDERWREWRWMKNYRIWEANRKVFVYPENWIEPELRDDKTAFFAALEAELLQDDLTRETAEAAFRNYVTELDKVARLEVVGQYHEVEKDAAGNTVVDALHVFGRTAGDTPSYYYRRRIDQRSWTPWESVDLDVGSDRSEKTAGGPEGVQLAPVVWRRRLYLVWPVFTKETEPAKPKLELDKEVDATPGERWRIQLAWSEYKDGRWLPKKVSAAAFVADVFMKDIAWLSPKRSYSLRAGPSSGKLVVQLRSHLDSGMIRDYGINGTQHFGNFVLTGCHSDFSFERVNQLYFERFARRTRPHFMSLEEAGGSGDQLYLPKKGSAEAMALQRTPGTFRILYNYQDGFDLRKRPWFFNDDARTYFVTPSKSFVLDWGFGVFLYPGILDDLYFVVNPFEPPIREKKDPVGPVVVADPRDPVIHAGDPLRFGDTFATPATVFAASDLGGGIAPRFETAGAGGGAALGRDTATGGAPRPEALFDTGGFGAGGLLLAERHPAFVLDSVKDTAIGRVKGHQEYRYKFHAFYHPYLCQLVEALNRNGVDGLLQRPLQLLSDSAANVFRATYLPVEGSGRLVHSEYPVEEFDFSFGGAYSQYNWELFFHAPLLIADRLRQNQRFEEAQRWYHYIFDPTDSSSLDAPQRYWRTKPFFRKTREDYRREHIVYLMRLLASGGDFDALPDVDDLTKQQLQKDYDDLVFAVAEWRADPFKPHLVARTRTAAYQKAVVRKYLDNLIEWADQLFRRDTLESINEATQLYVMAAEILGKRPEEIPPRAVPRVQTFNTIEPLLGEFSNAFVEIEEFVPPAALAAPVTSDVPAPSLPTMLYFCVPKNEKLIEYWDIVADRLFKIRHCQSIEGVVRQLPLFAPPIDPALLVKAVAAGIDIGSVLNDVSAPSPHYRFTTLAQKATELCGELRSLSAALLSALEKRDAEKLALLRAEHESELLRLGEEVRERQLEEAAQQIPVLEAQREVAAERYRHYQGLLGNDSPEVPAAPSEGQDPTPIPQQSASSFTIVEGEGGLKLVSHESSELSQMAVANTFQNVAAGFDVAAAIANFFPNGNIQPLGTGVTFGGLNVGAALSTYATLFRAFASDTSYRASRASRLAQIALRGHDWLLQSNLAAREIFQIDQQILAAHIRMAVADLELRNHRRQIDQASKIEDTLRDKFTNQELYGWMVGRISTVYFQAYQLAFDTAKRAERAYRHELGESDSSFIQFGYWDSLKKGLLSGDRLHQDLKRMEVAYLNGHKREFEITKHVSVARLDPVALLQLRQTGECVVSVPEAVFDLDFPGHYLRRLKSVAVTIPSVTGPYTNVSCTLTLLRSSVRHRPNLLSGRYARDLEGDDPRFTDSVGTAPSIATSSGRNDAGLFETNLGDPRFLPFEGEGAISVWRLELPRSFQAFDYDTITDVVLHLRYTARPAGGLLRDQALAELDAAVNSIVKSQRDLGAARVLSARHELGGAWHRFLNPATAEGDQTMTLPLTSERFPYLFQGRDLTVEVELFVKVNPAFEDAVNADTLKLSLAAGEAASDSALDLAPWQGLLRAEKTLIGSPAVWTLTAWLEPAPAVPDPPHERIDPNALDELYVVCHYVLA